ncbi:neuronal acetylcholine receptor subunit alpha-6-like [Pecten maximus]|uniref:neuronal acetylcholine receptor subunit alpha-6-like n=1 Tax=Pecten maximus TaxID=6579 RepID=UPI001458C4CC|nr:neuronal acetylcholine receptor subunit alpha-6-like [Pecten maximus]
MCRKIIYLCIVLSAATYCRSVIPEEDIMEDLFYSYNRHARPSYGPGHTVEVTHSLTLTRIVNMEKRVLTADTWQMMKWQDSRLMWDPDDYSQVDHINIPDELIWTPDIILYNNAAATSGKTYASIRVIVSSEGDAQWIPGTRVTAYCDEVTSTDRDSVQVGDYKCPLKFGSWTYHEKTMNMTIDGKGFLLGDYNESPDFEIIDHSVERETLTYSCCAEPYISITYTIWLRRTCQQTAVVVDGCDAQGESDNWSHEGSQTNGTHENNDQGTTDDNSDTVVDDSDDDTDDDGNDDNTDGDGTDDHTDDDDNDDDIPDIGHNNDDNDDDSENVQPVVTT